MKANLTVITYLVKCLSKLRASKCLLNDGERSQDLGILHQALFRDHLNVSISISQVSGAKGAYIWHMNRCFRKHTHLILRQ